MDYFATGGSREESCFEASEYSVVCFRLGPKQARRYPVRLSTFRGMHLGLGLDLDVGVLIIMDGSCFVLPYVERSMMMCLPGQYRCLLYVKSFLGMSVSAF